MLGHCLRLAGQHRFVGVQFVLVDQPEVGRHAVAGGQHDDVAGDQLRRVELLAMAAPAHGYRGGDASRQSGQRPFGLGLLPVANEGIDQHDAENHAGVHDFTEGGGDRAGGDQHQDQRLHDLIGEAAPGWLAGSFGQAV